MSFAPLLSAGVRRFGRAFTACLALVIGSLGVPALAVAADAASIVNEKLADFEPAIVELRDEAGEDRRAIVDANMLLSNSEKPTFWPLYDEYRAESREIGDRRVRMITDFIAERDSMSEEEAQSLLRRYFQIEEDTLALKKKYLKKMSKVLSARTVARFFDIDGKFDAAVDLAIAANIPLVH